MNEQKGLCRVDSAKDLEMGNFHLWSDHPDRPSVFTGIIMREIQRTAVRGREGTTEAGGQSYRKGRYLIIDGFGDGGRGHEPSNASSL